MSNQLLELVLTYGVFALAPVLIASAIGVPIPASLVLLAGGAFAGSGELPLVPLALVGIAATSAGDSLGYWLGRRGGRAALDRFGPRLGITPAAVIRADAFLARWGGVAILLTRFLITPLGPVLNLIAGAGRYPFRRFIAYDVVGEATWVALYLGIGYLFSASWDVLAGILGQASQLLAVAAIALVLLALLVRTLRQCQGRTGSGTEAIPLAVQEEGAADRPTAGIASPVAPASAEDAPIPTAPVSAGQ